MNVARGIIKNDIVEAAQQNPEQFVHLIEKIDRHQTSVDYVYQMVERSEDHKKENIPPSPQGQFSIIYADPPWPYNISLRGAAKNHYPTMALEDICNMKILADDNCALFLWSTQPMKTAT